MLDALAQANLQIRETIMGASTHLARAWDSLTEEQRLAVMAEANRLCGKTQTPIIASEPAAVTKHPLPGVPRTFAMLVRVGGVERLLIEQTGKDGETRLF